MGSATQLPPLTLLTIEQRIKCKRGDGFRHHPLRTAMLGMRCPSRCLPACRQYWLLARLMMHRHAPQLACSLLFCFLSSTVVTETHGLSVNPWLFAADVSSIRTCPGVRSTHHFSEAERTVIVRGAPLCAVPLSASRGCPPQDPATPRGAHGPLAMRLMA